MPIDYNKYPTNWLSEIRPRIMKRANNCCEVDGCGLEHMSIAFSGKVINKVKWWKYYVAAIHLKATDIKKVKVIITIAHLDHDENNHDVKDSRLMAMCQLHHLRYDAAEKKRRKISKSLNKL